MDGTAKPSELIPNTKNPRALYIGDTTIWLIQKSPRQSGSKLLAKVQKWLKQFWLNHKSGQIKYGSTTKVAKANLAQLQKWPNQIWLKHFWPYYKSGSSANVAKTILA